jgi:hypothetical protein
MRAGGFPSGLAPPPALTPASFKALTSRASSAAALAQPAVEVLP